MQLEHLGTYDGPSWHQAFIVLLGSDEGSRFKQVLNDVKYPGVNLSTQLLGGILDQIRFLTYGLSNKKGNKPKPTDLTGKNPNKEKQDFGEGMSVADMRNLLSQDIDTQLAYGSD